MGLFSPYQRKEPATAPEPDVQVDQPPAGRPKKTVPTPTRREAEAARRERINPALNPKLAKARERESTRESRLKALEAKDKGSARVLARDFVDSRWTISEFLMPVLLVTILLTLVGQQIWGTGQGTFAYQIMNVAMLVSYGMLIVVVVEIWLNWRRFKKLLAERFPRESTKGLTFYFVNRCISFRALRQPKPTVKRGVKL